MQCGQVQPCSLPGTFLYFDNHENITTARQPSIKAGDLVSRRPCEIQGCYGFFLIPMILAGFFLIPWIRAGFFLIPLAGLAGVFFLPPLPPAFFLIPLPTAHCSSEMSRPSAQ